jgi:hypothetical protein
MPDVGDKVFYVPGEDHKFERDHNGEFVWRFAARGRQGETVPLEDKHVAERLEQVKNQGRDNPAHAATLKAELLSLGPKRPWPATVTGVAEDGALDLDITHPLGGVTLHYSGVREDARGKTFHSWHRG